MKNIFVIAAMSLMAASLSHAQVEIIDKPINSSGEQGNSGVVGSVNQPSASDPSQMYYQLQLLQQEVLQLRGMLEEQAHELKRLKQQRLDDYLDLDRRVSQIGKVSPGNVAKEAAAPAPARNTLANSSDELNDYRQALDLLLKKQDYETAITAFNQHLTRFPKGRYAANAEYWLGEAYLFKGDLEQSRQWFSRLLTEFPSHSKVPDAKFKLGKVYNMLGDKEKAKALLEDVAASDANAASLARDYLNSNFQ